MQNGMMVNARKTELILFGDRRQLSRIEESPVISFMEQQLKCSTTVRNLGVIFDPLLSWEPHLKLVTDQCIGMLVALLHVKHLLPVHILPRIIDCLVFSRLRYCVQVYGSGNKTVIGKLQKVFNFAARVLSGRRKHDHISDILRQLNWLDAHQFIAFFDVCMMHKIIRTGEPEALRSRMSFNHETLQRTTRQSNHLCLVRAKNNHGKRLFTYRAAERYNEIVVHDVSDTVSYRVFKSSVRKYCLNSD